jgi:hypothetical protein
VDPGGKPPVHDPAFVEAGRGAGGLQGHWAEGKNREKPWERPQLASPPSEPLGYGWRMAWAHSKPLV